jgi:hypothetical protein
MPFTADTDLCSSCIPDISIKAHVHMLMFFGNREDSFLVIFFQFFVSGLYL